MTLASNFVVAKIGPTNFDLIYNPLINKETLTLEYVIKLIGKENLSIVDLIKLII